MSDDTWGGPLLVAGTITGVRHFGVTRDGWLYGPSSLWLFEPGENVALHRAPDLLPMMWGHTTFSGDVLRLRAQETERFHGWDEGHRVAGEWCRCGFYAYYDYDYSTYARDDRATAVIEGYGRVSCGNRGFRCEKARLVALALPLTTLTSTDRLLERRYQVPTYPNARKMLAKHSLSDPPTGTPEPEPVPIARGFVAFVGPMPVPAHVELVTPVPKKVLPPPPPDTPSKRWTWWRRR